MQVEALELAMDHVQKESASLKSERDEATQKMNVCQSRFDEFQVEELPALSYVQCNEIQFDI